MFDFYRFFISPFLHLIAGPGMGCRFYPSCSQYAEEAFSLHGSWKGFRLSIRRFMRCHPFGRSGFDPVPKKLGLVLLACFCMGARSLPLDLSGATVHVNNGTTFFRGMENQGYSVEVQSVTNRSGEIQFAFDNPELQYLDQVEGTLTETRQGVLWTYEDEKIKLTRLHRERPDQPYVSVTLRAELKTIKAGYAFVSVMARGLEDDPDSRDRVFNYYTDEDVERVAVADEHEVEPISTPVKWIGAANRYFALTAVAGDFLPTGLIQPWGATGGRLSMVYPVQGQSLEIPLKVYFGPKELSVIRAVEPTMESIVDLGFFKFLAYPMLMTLKWFYSFTANYGVAILLLTLLVKLVTYPLTYKSMVGMRKMSELQPEIQKLQKKYKGDREALNREMMHFMRTKGYNPMAGCWPVMIQMPIFFALYQVLYSAVELYGADFAFWLTDLSVADPYYVMPVLVSLTWWGQQKLTPNTISDPTQKKIMQLMPLIFGVFMVTLPSGLGIYFFANAVLSIVQQLVLNKKLGPPVNVNTAPA